MRPSRSRFLKWKTKSKPDLGVLPDCRAQGFKRLWLRLAGDAHRWVLATKGLTDTVAIAVDAPAP